MYPIIIRVTVLVCVCVCVCVFMPFVSIIHHFWQVFYVSCVHTELLLISSSWSSNTCSSMWRGSIGECHLSTFRVRSLGWLWTGMGLMCPLAEHLQQCQKNLSLFGECSFIFFIEHQVLETAPHKAAVVQPPTTHKWCTPVDPFT